MKNIHLLKQSICKIRYLNSNYKKSNLTIRKSFIQNIQHTIEENISDESFGILQLCKTIGLSRSQLHNKIKAQTGLSTSIYIRNIRLRKAKTLLNYSDLNISEIAYEVGFKDPSYFSRLYSDEFGIPPSKVRQSK